MLNVWFITFNIFALYLEDLTMLYIFFHEKCVFPVMCTCPTCWERERGIVGVAPPREKVKLWEALRVVCGLVIWWLTPPIRSKSSADGGTGVGLEAVGDCTPPNRSVTGWEGPEPDEVDGLAEKAFQSPNSPFPLDEGAADTRDQWLCLVLLIIVTLISDFDRSYSITSLCTTFSKNTSDIR